MNPKTLLNHIRYVISEPKRLLVREIPKDIEVAAEQFKATLSQDILWSLNGRFERGVALAVSGAVSHVQDKDFSALERLYRVQSANATRPPFSYLVDLDGGTCECPDHAKGHFCKHRIAAHIIEIVSASTVEADDSPKESIIWGVIQHENEWLGVEILSMQEEQATVRALPKIIDGKKLQPRFPFEGKHSVTIVPKESISHIKVFQ